MDCTKVGRLIQSLRRERGMTQKALANELRISDRTISKWERGIGCPDVSLLGALSAVLEVDIEKILAGDLEPNAMDGGNMKKIKFYACPNCGSTLFCTGENEISCCGRKQAPLTTQQEDSGHSIHVEEIEEDYYITLQHEMSKQHYITFMAYVAYDRVLFIKLYPEQDAQARFPKMRGGVLYVCCSKHGLIRKGKL